MMNWEKPNNQPTHLLAGLAGLPVCDLSPVRASERGATASGLCRDCMRILVTEMDAERVKIEADRKYDERLKETYKNDLAGFEFLAKYADDLGTCAHCCDEIVAGSDVCANVDPWGGKHFPLFCNARCLDNYDPTPMYIDVE